VEKSCAIVIPLPQILDTPLMHTLGPKCLNQSHFEIFDPPIPMSWNIKKIVLFEKARSLA